MALTPAQSRAARGLLNWSVAMLAEQTGLAINTVRRAESDDDGARITSANSDMIRSTLANAGVIFIDADDLGPGVRLKDLKPTARKRRREA